MFGAQKKPEPSKKTVNPSSTDTLIGQGTFLEGTLHSEAGIRLEGKINGQIEAAGDVVIGETGEAEADIHASTVTIAGIVRGNASVSGKCTITVTGQLIGNCTASTLVIEEGGRFEGTSAVREPEQKKPEPSKNASSEPMKKTS